MDPRLLVLPGNEPLAQSLARRRALPLIGATIRRFPDGEAYFRIDDAVEGATVWVVASLHPASEQVFMAMMAAATLRDLGAQRVGLIAPYLSYLRQDARFNPGEGVTSKYVGAWLSSHFDGLITVDPHLHRYSHLSQVYSIPTHVVRGACGVAAWIGSEINNPTIVGPDAESAQWVREVATLLRCPMVVLAKDRRGDRDVSIDFADRGDAKLLEGRTPVLLDDIISTGRTMIEALKTLGPFGNGAACVATHAVFGDHHDEVVGALKAAGARIVVTSNTIAHPTNAVDVGGLLVDALRECERTRFFVSLTGRAG